jgi:hypothetical protein
MRALASPSHKAAPQVVAVPHTKIVRRGSNVGCFAARFSDRLGLVT